MNKIRTIIIDDEKKSRDNTRLMLTKYFSEIEIVGEAENGIEGRKLINELHPDLVFLDVNMPELNGLEMLESIPEKEKNFYVIFLTAYGDYTIQAIRAGAVDYLMKPLMKEELMQAIKRVSKYIEEKKASHLASSKSNDTKLMVSHSKGFTLIDFSEIIMLEAAGNYTDFYLTNGRKIISSRTLKDYEDILDKNLFFRISRSAIVNLSHIKEYNNNNETLTLTEHHQIGVSKAKWNEFNEIIRSRTINPHR
ncbi:MAG: DNA-binding response regulator [Bacteroidia bacterium]|nr:MAG: DNA-binding response regulator [Bacteroidia bacterium]